MQTLRSKLLATLPRLVAGWLPSLLLLSGLSVFAYLLVVPSTGPPVAELSPPWQRVQARAPGAIEANFVIRNRGRSDLVLGEAKTTCGCTVASIDPTLVAPGRTCRVTVRGWPPDAGEKVVQVSIQSNCKNKGKGAGTLVLSLTMVGMNLPPYVAQSSESLQYGDLSVGAENRSVYLETVEPGGGAPWIQGAASTLPHLVIRGGLEREVRLDGGNLGRRYAYTVELKKRPPRGPFAGEIVFSGDKPANRAVARIPVRGFVRYPVSVSPSALFGSIVAHQDLPSLTVELRADDPRFSLSAEPQLQESAPIEVRRLKAIAGVVKFEVKPRDDCRRSISTTVNFRTNHRSAPSVLLPVTFLYTQ
jgi:Protein of unknown function (DUF1573)